MNKIHQIVNKTALVTGSSGGIGLELARIHAENGYNLVLVARSKYKLDELKFELEKKHQIQVYVIAKDLTLSDAPDEIYSELKQHSVFVDHLINNAGMGDIGLFADSDWNKQEQMIKLNITALTHLTRLFLPDMIACGSGKILNIASTASFQPGPTMSVYFASKAYVLSFSEAINEELSDLGITVTALCPGSTESGFHAVAIGEGKKLKERSLPTAREIARYGFRAMMKGRPVAIPGLKNTIMATSVRFFPRSLVVKAAGKIQKKKH
jgi:uncharacterized protein